MAWTRAVSLRCVDLPSGEILWATPQPLGVDRKLGSGSVFLVRANLTDKFWMFAEIRRIWIIGQLTPKRVHRAFADAQ